MSSSITPAIFVAPVCPVGISSTSTIAHYTVGEIFYDSLAGEMKIYNGTAWVKMGEFVQVSAQEKEDMLCKQHPGLKELRDLRDSLQTEEAIEKFEAYKALVEDHSWP